MGIFYENPVYTKVASVELPTKVSSYTFSNNNNVHLKRENVEKIANDHHGDHHSVLKHQTNTSAECTLDAGILDENPVAGEIVKTPKAELTEFGKLPSSEFTSSEISKRSCQMFRRDENKNVVPQVVKTEPVDSLNDERLDASSLSTSQEAHPLYTNPASGVCEAQEMLRVK
ncbi:hypothetical protein OROHE_015041 [Orobanche hederae]